MENSRILDCQGFSVIRKAQLIAGALGASVTILITLLAEFDFGLIPESAVSKILFDAFLICASPTANRCDALGIYQGNQWV